MPRKVKFSLQHQDLAQIALHHSDLTAAVKVFAGEMAGWDARLTTTRLEPGRQAFPGRSLGTRQRDYLHRGIFSIPSQKVLEIRMVQVAI